MTRTTRNFVIHVASGRSGYQAGRRSNMTENKRTVERYMDGFNKSDHEQILLCLTEDVEWEMPGAFHLYGKDAFDKEIENDAFVGSPTITITRMTRRERCRNRGRGGTSRKKGGWFSQCGILRRFYHEQRKNQAAYYLPGRSETGRVAGDGTVLRPDYRFGCRSEG